MATCVVAAIEVARQNTWRRKRREHPRRSDEEYFINLEDVWIKLAKQPHFSDMKIPFSKYSGSGYVHNFGTWRKALERFIEYVNKDHETTSEDKSSIVVKPTVTTTYKIVSCLNNIINKSDSVTILVEPAPIPTRIDTLCSFGPWIQIKAEIKSYFDPEFIWREYEFSRPYVEGRLTFNLLNGRYSYKDSTGVQFGNGDWSLVGDSLYWGAQFPSRIDTLNETLMVLTMKIESYDGPEGLTFVGYSYTRKYYRH